MREALKADSKEAAVDLSTSRFADAADFLDTLPSRDAARRLADLNPNRAARILNQAGLDHCDILADLPVKTAADLLDRMSADRRAEVIRRLPKATSAALRNAMKPRSNADIDHILSYPARSVGSIMTVEFLSATTEATVAEVLAKVRSDAGRAEMIYAIYLIDPKTTTLARVISLRDLISANPDVLAASIARHQVPLSVLPFAPREDAARLISKYDLLALPVVDTDGHLLGIVTVDDIIDAIVNEDTAATQRLGGSQALEEPYTRISFGGMIRKRAGWLCALFLSEMLTASAMQHFEGELEKAIVLTLFIPLIMSSGGNSGSQATSLIIRALALGEVKLRDWWRVALRELPTGICLGAILGTIGVARIALWQFLGFYNYGPHWPLIALTVGTALTAIVGFGSLTGSLLPFALQRLGFDPASASAPFVATLVDVTGLVIYFSVALLILSGTVLNY